MIKRRKHSVWVHRMDISRSTIDRERWQIKKRKISEKQNIKKKGYDQARGRTHVNIRAAFQRWRELKERERLESDAKVALFLFDRWVTSILLRFTQLLCETCWLLFEYACVSSSLVSAIVVAMVVYVHVGWRFQNKGEVLLGYGRVGFEYQHRLAKIA